MSNTTLQTSLEDLEKENQKLKEKYNSLVCKLEERLRCPVCLEVPTTGPVYNCLYGHSVCSSCYTGYNSDCPQCRVKMYKITSLLAATVIENIDHTCQHEGCGERFPADLLGIHHDQCNFRLVKCPALKCVDTIQFNNWSSWPMNAVPYGNCQSKSC